MRIASIIYFAIWQLGTTLSGAQQLATPPARPRSAEMILVSAQNPGAQQFDDQGTNRSNSDSLPEIFIQLDDSPSIADTNLKGIKSFAETLLQLRLISSAKVHRGAAPQQACPDTSQTSPNAGRITKSPKPAASEPLETGR